MELIWRNVMRHVYEVLQRRRRLADNGNISNLQSFYNRVMSEYSVSAEKKGQYHVVPLTGQDVDDFYSHSMSQEDFTEIVRTKLITKVTNFDLFYKSCWECYCGPPEDNPQRAQMIMLIDQQSALLLWLLFCKLDTDGGLKLLSEDVTEVIMYLLRYTKGTPDQKTVEAWLSNQTENWISFWQFFTVAVQKCLSTRTAQVVSRAVKALYIEIVDEVLKCAVMCKKGNVMPTWKMRWFVLKSSNLTCYESKESLIRKDTLIINFNASVTKVMQEKNEKDCRYPNRFKVTDGITGQFFDVSADSPAQMNEWIDAINLAIKLSIIEGRNYIHRLQIAQRNVSAEKPQQRKSIARPYGSIASTIQQTETVSPPNKSTKSFSKIPEETTAEQYMTLRRLQSQPHPRSHEYINVVSNARRSTSPRLEGRDHRSHSEDYGTIPLQSTAIREQKTFNKGAVDYLQIQQNSVTMDGSQHLTVPSPTVVVHEYDTVIDLLLDQAENPKEEHQNSMTRYAKEDDFETPSATTAQSPSKVEELELFAKIQLQEEQLQEMVGLLHSLQQSVMELLAGLSTEKQRSSTLEAKYQTLHSTLITEQHNNQLLLSRCQSLETKCESLDAALISKQQKTESLEERCEHLESSVAAEQQRLEAKCNSQEERLRTMENTVERLWAISRDEINLSNKILGTGGWGYVTEATFRGRRVAAKCLHEAITSQHNQELFAKEMKISAQCRHKNLIEFIGAVPDHPAIIVIEMMDCTLRSALNDATVTLNHIHPICIDVAQGLVYLHSIWPHPLIHRDVSAPNVLLKAVGTGWIAKLSDLGSAQFANKAQTCAPGCLLYAAPEILQSDTALKQTEKVDVHSYGVLLIEILTREIPSGTISQLISSLIPIWPQFISLIQRCSNTDSTRRPTMKEVINSLNKITV